MLHLIDCELGLKQVLLVRNEGSTWAARAARFCIRVYQRFISTGRPATCRYRPTCSAYAAGAIETHGAIRGIWMGVRRISKCHPLGEGGHDPVPEKRQ